VHICVFELVSYPGYTTQSTVEFIGLSVLDKMCPVCLYCSLVISIVVCSLAVLITVRSFVVCSCVEDMRFVLKFLRLYSLICL
jgi:hypothetical protein